MDVKKEGMWADSVSEERVGYGGAPKGSSRKAKKSLACVHHTSLLSSHGCFWLFRSFGMMQRFHASV